MHARLGGESHTEVGLSIQWNVFQWGRQAGGRGLCHVGILLRIYDLLPQGLAHLFVFLVLTRRLSPWDSGKGGRQRRSSVPRANPSIGCRPGCTVQCAVRSPRGGGGADGGSGVPTRRKGKQRGNGSVGTVGDHASYSRPGPYLVWSGVYVVNTLTCWR
jgi:hypothetical protein